MIKRDYCMDTYLVAVNVIGFEYAGFQAYDCLPFGHRETCHFQQSPLFLLFCDR